MFWTKRNKDKTAEAKEALCPNCRVSDETLEILKKKSFAPAKASASAPRASADESADKEENKKQDKI